MLLARQSLFRPKYTSFSIRAVSHGVKSRDLPASTYEFELSARQCHFVTEFKTLLDTPHADTRRIELYSVFLLYLPNNSSSSVYHHRSRVYVLRRLDVEN